MFRRAILAAGLALAAASLVHAQQPTAPAVPEDALTPRELIAWSSLQTPQPARQQLPAAQAQPNQDPAQAPPAADPEDRQVPAQSLNQNAGQARARDPRGPEAK